MRRTLRFLRILLAARRLQDWLWNKPGERVYADVPRDPWESWIRNLGKRVARLSKIDAKNPHWRVEARKRLLQLATVAVAFIEAIDAGVAPGDDHHCAEERHANG